LSYRQEGDGTGGIAVASALPARSPAAALSAARSLFRCGGFAAGAKGRDEVGPVMTSKSNMADLLL
jgi:hypothetical protein